MIADLKKRKKFFVGIDSDGTAFDSMTIKHSGVFIPTMIKVWNLEKYAPEVKTINEKINLYSASRGVNRFTGLKMAFDCMKEQGIPIPDYEELVRFIDSKVGLSNDALKKYMEELLSPSDFLQEVLNWSEEADVIFTQKTEKLLPFPYVKAVLEILGEYADIVVVSSATASSLNKDWKRVGLDMYVSEILGQEAGSKKEQLIASTAGQYAEEHILMIGDAWGDYQAVQKVNGLFYPILPGREVESWEKLLKEGASLFVEEKFKGAYQEELLKVFATVLG